MNIVVCVKQVPDSAAVVSVRDGKVTWGDAALVINPWDEYAVEVALQLSEAHGGEVTALSLAGENEKEALKIALAMGAGATFTEAVRTVIREDPKHPFNVELNTVLAEVELGTTRQQALRNMADRVPLESLRSIVASIIQAEGLGTPLSDVLKGQATLMRLQRSVRAEKLAAAASVRILVPSLLILVSVVLTVFGPVIIRAIKGELFY